MTSEIKADDEVIKTKNPKRVSAGKKGAEAKRLKAELKRKEMEAMKKENIQLKSITKDDDEVSNIVRDDVKKVKEVQYKNYIPLCIVGVIVGLGLYIYNKKQVTPAPLAPTKQQKEIDPFEFN